MSISTANPATGLRIRSYREDTGREVDSALDRAGKAFAAWRALSFEDRSRGLRSAAAVLRRRADKLARLATDEMGKPLSEARAEVQKCRLVCAPARIASMGASRL
jgi:succinate-semialdehyde dehydrogenase/glutarate-semialdehyde dehydrogenase